MSGVKQPGFKPGWLVVKSALLTSNSLESCPPPWKAENCPVCQEPGLEGEVGRAHWLRGSCVPRRGTRSPAAGDESGRLYQAEPVPAFPRPQLGFPPCLWPGPTRVLVNQPPEKEKGLPGPPSTQDIFRMGTGTHKGFCFFSILEGFPEHSKQLWRFPELRSVESGKGYR